MSMKIYIPRETAAISMGANQVADLIQEFAKKMNIEVEIIRNGSRGASFLEPLVEVETPDGRKAFGPVFPEDVEGFMNGTAEELSLGLTEEIPYLKNQERLTFARCGLNDPTDIEAYKNGGGYDGLSKALATDDQSLVDEVMTSGLRGRGGAAFPAGIKWQTVLNAEADQKYIACNADEGDSGTFSDRLIMEGDPLTLLEGMTIAGLAVGATKGYIYLRSEYPLAKTILAEAIAAATSANWLGDDIQKSGKGFTIEVRMGAGAYICGEETSMLESLEGKRGQVRAKPPLPALEGLFGKPTVVNNVITLASVPNIIAKGGEAYASYGQGRSLGTLPFQLAGNIKQGGLVEKAFGVTLRELIEGFGGGTASGRPIKAIQIGGPLGAYVDASVLDTKLDYEDMAAIGAMVGHGGIVVFDNNVDMSQQARFAMEFCAIESCGKCTPCRIGSIRGVEVIDKIKSGDNATANWQLLEDLCDTMEDASLCAMGGMTPFPVRSAMKLFSDDFKETKS